VVMDGLKPVPFRKASFSAAWNLVALANFMRLSLLKGAYAGSPSAAWLKSGSGNG
jgi:hypothetical protein